MAISSVTSRAIPRSAVLVKTSLLAVGGILMLTACTTPGYQSTFSQSNAAPTSLVAAPTTQVQSSALPGIDGQPTGDPWLVSSASPIDGESDIPNIVQDPNLPSIVDVQSTANVVGRDLSGSLTKEKMIGGWTISTPQGSCRLFLTLTAKDGRHRAATPACESPSFTDIATWQLVGNQVQLFNATGTLIGNLARTGDRFIGTMVGGLAVSIFS